MESGAGPGTLAGIHVTWDSLFGDGFGSLSLSVLTRGPWASVSLSRKKSPTLGGAKREQAVLVLAHQR